MGIKGVLVLYVFLYFYVDGQVTARVEVQKIGTQSQPSYCIYYEQTFTLASEINGCSNGNGGCGNLCIPLPGGSRMCDCPDLMTLRPDGQTCRNSSFLLVTSNDLPAIYLMDLINDYDIEIPLKNLDTPYAITYDPIDGVIYWTDTKLHRISSASISGNSERIVRMLKGNASPQGISVDAMSRLLFYSDKKNGIIAVLSLNGYIQKIVINSNLEEPDAIVTNPIQGTIYWTSLGDDGTIETSNYDGTNRQMLISTGLVKPSGLAIDIREGVLYWCIAGDIYRFILNGLNSQLIYQDDRVGLFRIAFYESYLYFTATSQSQITRIGRDGSNPTSFGPYSSGTFVDLHVHDASESIDTNGCSNGSGGCSHFCFPQPGGFTMCACPDSMTLQREGQTCVRSNTSLTTSTTMTAQSDRPPSSCEISGSAVELTVMRPAVGSLAGLLVISVLLNVHFVRKNRRLQMENKRKQPHVRSMTTENESGEYHTISPNINTEIGNMPEAFSTVWTHTASYRARSDEQDGYLTSNIAGGNDSNGYIHSIDRF